MNEETCDEFLGTFHYMFCILMLIEMMLKLIHCLVNFFLAPTRYAIQHKILHTSDSNQVMMTHLIFPWKQCNKRKAHNAVSFDDSQVSIFVSILMCF